MKAKYIVGPVVAALFVAALVYFFGGSQAPAGQPSLTTLTAANLAEIQTDFNNAKDSVRVLLLLSPT